MSQSWGGIFHSAAPFAILRRLSCYITQHENFSAPPLGNDEKMSWYMRGSFSFAQKNTQLSSPFVPKMSRLMRGGFQLPETKKAKAHFLNNSH